MTVDLGMETIQEEEKNEIWGLTRMIPTNTTGERFPHCRSTTGRLSTFRSESVNVLSSHGPSHGLAKRRAGPSLPKYRPKRLVEPSQKASEEEYSFDIDKSASSVEQEPHANDEETIHDEDEFVLPDSVRGSFFGIGQQRKS